MQLSLGISRATRLISDRMLIAARNTTNGATYSYLLQYFPSIQNRQWYILGFQMEDIPSPIPILRGGFGSSLFFHLQDRLFETALAAPRFASSILFRPI